MIPRSTTAAAYYCRGILTPARRPQQVLGGATRTAARTAATTATTARAGRAGAGRAALLLRGGTGGCALVALSFSLVASSDRQRRALAEAAGGGPGGPGAGGPEDPSLLSRLAGFFSSSSSVPQKEEGRSDDADDADNEDDDGTVGGGGPGPGKRVKVELEAEVVEALPVVSLEEVRECDGSSKKSATNDGGSRLLVTYEGIVYDVTEFVNDHPGGNDLIRAAAGWDLEHYFANYTVHGVSEKAARWLAPLAVGRLSPEDARRARDETTPHVHVARRQNYLGRKRRQIVLVAASLPFWLTVRAAVAWIGWIVPSLGRLLARAVPVSVPGLSVGAEPLPLPAPPAAYQQDEEEKEEPYKVAIIGGGIAGCGAAWALTRSGFAVTLYEARPELGGNAKTFGWDFSPFRRSRPQEEKTVKTCVSVTAWPPLFYKNYTCLLDLLGIETVHQPLSWFINSKVPGYEGTLWEADPVAYDGSLRKVFERDFRLYKGVCNFTRFVTNVCTLRWTPWRWNDLPSMYDSHQGLGLLNPLNVVPLYSIFRMVGGSEAWWNIVFTPQYTASFLVDELRPFPAVFGPLIEAQIPLNPNATNSWQGPSKLAEGDCNITTCVTWKDAGKGIRKVFELLVQGVDVKKNARIREVEILKNGKKRVYDEYDQYVDVDRVIFACPANAVGNIYKSHSRLAGTIFSTIVYADDHHPSTGHMHAVMHSDPSVIQSEYREECLKRASNYVEVTQLQDGTINIENQYNFGVQTPGPGIYDLPLDQKPVMLIGHALGEGKSYDPSLVRGTGNHARAHPLYSGWNVAAQLSLRLVQGQNGIYYCSNWTTPGNCHDMSFLSGLVCAHAIGAKYPFANNREAKKDFGRLRELMGI